MEGNGNVSQTGKFKRTNGRIRQDEWMDEKMEGRKNENIE